MQDISDDILKKAAEGDLESFELIYKASARFVYNVALRVVGNREDAKEVTQEVFLIMHRNLKNFRFQSSFKTWAYRITANHAINFAKKASRHKMTPFDDRFMEQSVPHESETEMNNVDNQNTVERLLGAINPEQRACVVLRNIEGFSYEQISETLKININTVRSRLNRAREKLLALRKQGRI